MRRLGALLLIFGMLTMGCVKTEPEVVCNKPYIRVGAECCLDSNNNAICDRDEQIPTQQSQPVSCVSSGTPYCSGNTRFYGAICQNGQWIYQSEHCSYGCEGGACKSQACPPSCDDGNACTRDYCSSATNFGCAHDSLSGAQSGCSGSAGTCSQYICSSGNCITQPLVPCCGNGVCETGETYVTCLKDCPAPAPKLDVEILGCDTGYDIKHGLGEVTNVYAEIRNIGNADAYNVIAVSAASDEGEEHPNKYAVIGDIPAGYMTIRKMTVDTTYEVFATITVAAAADNADITQESINDCTEIDPKTIEGLDLVIKIVGLG